MNGVIQILLANQLLLSQRREAFDLELRFVQCHQGLRQSCLSLVQHNLERPRIDLKHESFLCNEGTFSIMLGDEIARHPRLNMSIDKTFERSDPFGIKRQDPK